MNVIKVNYIYFYLQQVYADDTFSVFFFWFLGMHIRFREIFSKKRSLNCQKKTIKSLNKVFFGAV